MLRSHILREFGITELEHLGYPTITDMAIADNAEVVDHPVDGLAGAGLAEVIALRSVAQLFVIEHRRWVTVPEPVALELCSLATEGTQEGPVEDRAPLNHTELRWLRDTELLPEVLEGIRKCFFEFHLSHIFWGRTQKPQPPYISDLLIGGLQYRGRLQNGGSSSSDACEKRSGWQAVMGTGVWDGQSRGPAFCGVNPDACPRDCPGVATFSS